MKYLPLTKCLDKIIDNRGKTVPTCETGIPLIATNCIRMDSLYPVFDKVRYISQHTYDNWFRAHLKPNDILFVNKGTPGKVALCPDPLNFVIAQDAIGLRANEDIVYWKYLYYYLKSSKVQSVIENNNVGLIIPHFKKEFLDRIEIPILPMSEQIKIGDTLHNIDIQIQGNKDMCHKLQVLAQTTYSRWFNQFEFPNEDGLPYKSSGGKMVWSDKLKREIPDGWDVKTLGDLLLEKEKSKIQVGEVRDNGGVFPFFTSGENILLYKDCFVNGPHCYLNTGGNADVKFFDGKASYSTDTWCISFGEFTYYINEFLQLIKPQIDKFFFSGSGLQHLQKESFKQLKLFVPDDKTLMLYNDIVSGCYQQIAKTYIENNYLQSLKNNILPLLINGQLNI